MNTADAAKLLTVCAAYDNRKPNEDQAKAWALALDGLDFIACRDAVVSHYQESREWIMPADIRTRVRRARAKAIANDEALELPPHDPDDTALHQRLLVEARRMAAEGRTYEPQGLVRRNLRELGGPVRRVNELEDNDRRNHAERARAAGRDALRVLAEAPAPEPDPPATFACEHRDGDAVCGDVAPHLSADRRRPLCDTHREPQPTADDQTEAECLPNDREAS